MSDRASEEQPSQYCGLASDEEARPRNGSTLELVLGFESPTREVPMVCRVLVGFALASVTVAAFASGQEVPAPRDVEIAVPEGVKLKATYYAAGRPGPAVLLLHMCNTDRRSWQPLGPQLAAVGLHALALDYRGYGESGGERFEDDPQRQQKVVNDKWPGDVDAGLAWLRAQPGVEKSRFGAAGGSCGVNQAVQVARRHPDEARSLVLLAGGTSNAGLQFLRANAWLPVFAAAAADDQYGADFVPAMRWLTELTGNPRNRFVGFTDGRHGTEIFGPHPELPRQIVEWYVDTLVKTPADPKAPMAAPQSAAARFWAALEGPRGASRAVELFREARKRDPKAYLFPEAFVNQMAYERIAAGETKEAIELCRLNTEAYPASANAYDSLADAYLADGQTEAAMQAAHMAMEKLPADKSSEDFKARVKQSAERKLKLPAEKTPKNP
jgi:pimeloyl-ACP methyl ester carboxylesterase